MIRRKFIGDVRYVKNGTEVQSAHEEENKMGVTEKAVKVLEEALNKFIDTNVLTSYGDEKKVEMREFKNEISTVAEEIVFHPDYASIAITELLRSSIKVLKKSIPQKKSKVDEEIEALEEKLKDLKSEREAELNNG